jgi:hypothetical protein
VKVAFIVPDKMILHSVDTGYYLTLPWNIALYKDKVGYTILDNGAAEDYELDINEYLALMHQYSPHEIVLPDVLRNYQATMKKAEGFLFDHTSDLPRGIGMMGVAQGHTWAEFKLAALDFARLEDVTTLGIPKHMTSTLADSWARVEYVHWLMQEGLEDSFPMGIHCLGGSDWIREVRVLAELEVIRGIDTSVPAILAIKGTDIEGVKWRAPRQENFFAYEPNLTQDIELLYHNQLAYMGWADGSV